MTLKARINSLEAVANPKGMVCAVVVVYTDPALGAVVFWRVADGLRLRRIAGESLESFNARWESLCNP